jgi:hypothetical protein
MWSLTRLLLLPIVYGMFGSLMRGMVAELGVPCCPAASVLLLLLLRSQSAKADMQYRTAVQVIRCTSHFRSRQSVLSVVCPVAFHNNLLLTMLWHTRGASCGMYLISSSGGCKTLYQKPARQSSSPIAPLKRSLLRFPSVQPNTGRTPDFAFIRLVKFAWRMP